MKWAKVEARNETMSPTAPRSVLLVLLPRHGTGERSQTWVDYKYHPSINVQISVKRMHGAVLPSRCERACSGSLIRTSCSTHVNVIRSRSWITQELLQPQHLAKAQPRADGPRPSDAVGCPSPAHRRPWPQLSPWRTVPRHRSSHLLQLLRTYENNRSEGLKKRLN